MDGQTKRVWSRPELIVIVRGGSEEAVLTACKVGHAPGGNGVTVNECKLRCTAGPCQQNTAS